MFSKNFDIYYCILSLQYPWDDRIPHLTDEKTKKLKHQ